MRLIDADSVVAEIEKNKLMAREPATKRCMDIIKNTTIYALPPIGVETAKKLLIDNGYVVVKWTKSMEKAADECEEMNLKGENKDCGGCPCSLCLIQ